MYIHIQHILDKTFFNRATSCKYQSGTQNISYLILWISKKNPILNLIYKNHLYFYT